MWCLNLVRSPWVPIDIIVPNSLIGQMLLLPIDLHEVKAMLIEYCI